jgi:superfamily I DNA/RNA helicase
MEKAGIPVVVLEQTDPGPEQPGVRAATMHRVKGLEFAVLVIVCARDGVIPLASEIESEEDVEVRDEALLRERSLLYTAATRARDRLFITAAGTLTRFLEPR